MECRKHGQEGRPTSQVRCSPLSTIRPAVLYSLHRAGDGPEGPCTSILPAAPLPSLHHPVQFLLWATGQEVAASTKEGAWSAHVSCSHQIMNTHTLHPSNTHKHMQYTCIPTTNIQTHPTYMHLHLTNTNTPNTHAQLPSQRTQHPHNTYTQHLHTCSIYQHANTPV